MTALLIGNNSEPLGGPNTGTSVEFGDSWNTAVAKLNQASSQAGQTTVNFGVAPGAADTSTVITGQPNIVAGSSVDAWIIASPTADHSADEHWADPPLIIAGNIIPGIGFTIYARCQGDDGGGLDQFGGAGNFQTSGVTVCYGAWSVAWQWL